MTDAPGRSDDGGLRRRFQRHLREHPELLPPESPVVVAVSGGPDSMALLDLVTREEPGEGTGPRGVVAAHFDHALRPESGREARRVVDWCRDRGIPWIAAGPSRPLEPDPAACRRARYSFLEGARRDLGASRIATGHHADDQCETVLFRILRGTGLRGLRGMVPLRDALCRPLLPFREHEIRAYAERRGLPFHRDPSNLDPGYARSRIRHRLLPALEARNRGVREKLLSVARMAREADGALDRLAERIVSACRLPDGDGGGRDRVRLRRGILASLDEELRGRVLQRLARAEGVRLTRGGTRSAIQFISVARSGARMDLGGGLVLGRDFDVLWIRPDPGSPGEDREVSLRLPGSGSAGARIGGARYRVAWGPRPPGPESGGGHSLRLAPEAVGGQLELVVRGWRPGDRIRLPAGTRKLKDVFMDRRVPRSLRSRLPVVAEADGPVRWVPGVCTAEAWGAAADRTPSPPDGDGWWLIIAEDDHVREGPGEP